MLLHAEQSLLLLIDLQNKLAPAIANFNQVEQYCADLLQISRELNVPVLVSEQYPQGLGVTVQSLLQHLQPQEILEKLTFSAVKTPAIAAAIADLKRPQIVLAGVEAHVCVLQTALDLVALGYQVYVVADACASRKESDRQLALQRLSHAGVHLVSREMVIFEWLEAAGSTQFRQISRQYLR